MVEKEEITEEETSKEPKRYFRRSVGWWVSGWTRPAKTVLPTATRMRITGYKRTVSLVASIFRGVTPEMFRAFLFGPKQSISYDEMLFSWSMTHEMVPAVMSRYRLMVLVNVIAAIAFVSVAAWYMSQGTMGGFLFGVVATLFFLMSTINALITGWRLGCLKRREYMGFGQWLGIRRLNHR